VYGIICVEYGVDSVVTKCMHPAAFLMQKVILSQKIGYLLSSPVT